MSWEDGKSLYLLSNNYEKYYLSKKRRNKKICFDLKMKMTRERDVAIDFEKGLFLFLIVIGHFWKIAKFNVVVSVLNLLPVSIFFILFSKGFSPVSMYVLNISIFGVLVALVKVLFAHKICGLKYSSFFKELFLPSITTFVTSFSIAFIPKLYMDQSWSRMFFTFALSFLSYISLFYFICMNENERSLIKTMFYNFQVRFRR